MTTGIVERHTRTVRWNVSLCYTREPIGCRALRTRWGTGGRDPWELQPKIVALISICLVKIRFGNQIFSLYFLLLLVLCWTISIATILLFSSVCISSYFVRCSEVIFRSATCLNQLCPIIVYCIGLYCVFFALYLYQIRIIFRSVDAHSEEGTALINWL